MREHGRAQFFRVMNNRKIVYSYRSLALSLACIFHHQTPALPIYPWRRLWLDGDRGLVLCCVVARGWNPGLVPALKRHGACDTLDDPGSAVYEYRTSC